MIFYDTMFLNYDSIICMAIDIKDILENGLLDLCHKKDLSQITVKDLLETTGVSRQTFYNHFLDKNDLIQYIYNHKIIDHFNGQNPNLNFYESLIHSFKHMKQYQTFLKQACLMEGQNCLKEYISKHCEDFDLKWHQQLYGEKPMPDALKFATIYHANASSAMTLSWILSDMKVPVEEMAKMITQMRGLGMDDLFQGSDCTTNPYKIDK